MPRVRLNLPEIQLTAPVNIVFESLLPCSFALLPHVNVHTVNAVKPVYRASSNHIPNYGTQRQLRRQRWRYLLLVLRGRRRIQPHRNAAYSGYRKYKSPFPETRPSPTPAVADRFAILTPRCIELGALNTGVWHAADP